MKPTSHHAPEEMHNDDTAHEHSDINIGALAWSMVVMFGTVIVTAGLMYVLFNFLERRREGQGSQALAADDAGDGDAEVDDVVAVLRQCAGAEADDRRARVPEGSPDGAAGRARTPPAGSTRRPAWRGFRSIGQRRSCSRTACRFVRIR